MLYMYNQTCCLLSHQSDIDNYYFHLTECIINAMRMNIPTKRCSISEFCVTGWSDIVADKHIAARQAVLE